MKRERTTERPNYVDIVNSQWLVYTHEDPAKDPKLFRYWRENGYYSISYEEYEILAKAAEAMFEMCVEAGDWLLFDEEGRHYLSKYFHIPEYAMPAIIASWNEEPTRRSVYGRFDIRFGGTNYVDPRTGERDPSMAIPKLYEFNADTPTSIVESAFAQWGWLENVGKGRDQFNSIYEDLEKAWTRNLHELEIKLGFKPKVWFAFGEGDESREDEMNTALIMEACRNAGYETELMYIENVWIDDDGRVFDRASEEHIDVLFKLYPWEHIAHLDNAPEFFADMMNSGFGEDPYRGGTVWIEAPYKLLWSTKAILPVLWKLFGGDAKRSQFLIPSWFEDEVPNNAPELSEGRVYKPYLSREGADITLEPANGAVVHGERQGYGEEGRIVQQLAYAAVFERYGKFEFVPKDEHRTVFTVPGIWMVDGVPSGMGIRESAGPITDNFANFVPHSISDGEIVVKLTPPPIRTLATANGN